MRALRSAGVLALALVLGACGSEDSGGNGGDGSGALEVVAQDISFDPTTLDVEAGAEVTVTLTNEDDTEHTFSIEELDVEAEAAGGENAEATFTAPDSGSLEYFCEYHPDAMTGTLSVGGDTGGAPEEETETEDEGAEKEDEGGGGKQY
jgi:plastocyanin